MNSKTTLNTYPIHINRIPLDLGPDPRMVTTRYFNNGEKRSRELIRRLLQLDQEVIQKKFNRIKEKFENRHRYYITSLKNNYKNIQHIVKEEANNLGLAIPLPDETQSLIGSYFTMEYSVAAVALFNPSIVPAPNIKTDDTNRLDFVLSLRATGEGHISSIVFRTGHYLADKDKVYIDEPRFPIKNPNIQRLFNYDKNIFSQKLKDMGIKDYFRKSFIECIENNIFSYQDFQIALRRFEKKIDHLDERDEKFWFNKIKWLAESHLELLFQDTNKISQKVIFPLSEHERNGIEDARFVQFFDKGQSTYYGTYTAYDGRVIMTKLIRTNDFQKFEIRPLQGKKNYQKNFALFPRKINGKYTMLSRIDGYNHYLMYSDDAYQWDNALKIEVKKNLWELVQVGNCGSPLETPEGWLVISHGVGAMREYGLGMMLLDLDDPSRVIANLPYPLMLPQEDEREGYVPNVLYSCGSLIYKNKLLLPYACSDIRIHFATLSTKDILNELKQHRL